jgi:glutaminyl-tRNA synthetase
VLRELVAAGHVSGWDDPRMPTLSAMRRRGYPPAAIRRFWTEIGVAKRDNTIQLARLEHAIREELNRTAPRAMAVIRPLRLVVENYPEDAQEELDAVNNPEDASMGSRRVPFARELWIERDDFAVEPPKGFHRLSPGREVRLRYAYLVTCTGYEQDAEGNVTAVRCRYDPATRGGDAPDGRKVRGTLHWVSAGHAVEASVRLYDVLFTVEDPLAESAGADFSATLNPNSLSTLTRCKLEPSLAEAEVGRGFQFERLGYFCVDRESRPGARVWNRTVTLRDTWAKLSGRAPRGAA